MRKLTFYVLFAIVANTSVMAAPEQVEPTTDAAQTVPKFAEVEKPVDETRVDALVSIINDELKAKNFTRAKLVFLAAKKGNPKACNLVGWMFDNGVAVKKDSGKALKWFDACSKRNPVAAYNAGVLFAEGRGTERNPVKMIEYFKRASALGGSGMRSLVPQIPIRLAHHYHHEKAYGDAWEWAEKAADVDSRHGRYLVARMLAEKTAPYSDDARARGYLTDAMEAGSAPAASMMAWSYATGRLTEKDPILAYEHELIAYKIDPRHYAQPKYGTGLSDELKKQAESMASNWRSTHREATPMDFTSTLDGTEKQFSSK